MKTILVYPTFILKTKDNEDYPFLVFIPDLDIITEAKDFTDGIEMARDAIGITVISMEDNKELVPDPSSSEIAFEKLKEQAFDMDVSNIITTYVDVDIMEYRRKTDTRSVRKNVTIPSWLNYEAEKAGINVSRVLQDALISTLGVTKRI